MTGSRVRKMFADSSALVSILVEEPDSRLLTGKLDAAARVLVSGLAYYETATGVARANKIALESSRELVDRLLTEARAEFIPIDAAIASTALEAFARYGKGRHRAALNMGDCFSYACAKVHRVPLLCKGRNFKLTDINLA